MAENHKTASSDIEMLKNELKKLEETFNKRS